jgi:hypothetical protein
MHQQQENLKFMSHFPHGLIIKQVPTGRKFGRITQKRSITNYPGTIIMAQFFYGEDRTGGRLSLAGVFAKKNLSFCQISIFISCFKLMMVISRIVL